jgi:type I restriction enzyme S subunit
MNSNVLLGQLATNITDGKHGDCNPENGSGFYFVSVKDLKDGFIDYPNAREITEVDFIDAHKRTRLEEGDILLANSGHTIGKMFFVHDAPQISKTTFQKSVALIKPNTSVVNGKYLYYNLLANVKGLKRAAVGSAQPNLLLMDLRTFKLSVCEELEAQGRIADVLSSLDDKIQINNKINAELEAMAKLIYDYWFVQFDFLNEDGKPYKSSGGKMVYNEELKREIPEGWEVKMLIELCAKIGDGIHGTPNYVEESEYKFINGNNLRNGFIQTDSDTKCVSDEEYKKYFIDLNDGTILLSINGTLGNLAVYTGEKVMLGKSSAYINCQDHYSTYCYQFLKQPHMPKLFWNVATGSTIKNLSLDSIKKLKISDPNNNLVEKFQRVVSPLDDRRKVIYKENQELASLRDWLLPMLMNGQVKVGEGAVTPNFVN